MTANNHIEAEIHEVKTISKIWLLPVVALFIAVWMIYYQWSNQGSLITLHFISAEGIEAGKTKIKFRNVNIGSVKKVQLNEDGEDVLVTARISKAAERLLVSDSQFWVVSPKVSLDGISGLSTLISGVYIKLSQGESEEDADEFYALESPPVTPLGTPGLHITLNSNDQFAYEKGDPILYKGLTVGQFEDIYFNFEERIVYYNAFIKAPYHELLTTNTKFWDITGLNIDLKAEGVSIKTGNLQTLLSNGVTFDIPEGIAAGEKITERNYFDIYESYKDAKDKRYKQFLEYIVLVSTSVRGLVIGAPVEYRGINIGEVAAINHVAQTENPFFTDDFKIPVLLRVQPGRVGLPDDEIGMKTMDKQHEHWIKNGLKATLKTGNILTGSLFIELQHFENQFVDTIDEYAGYSIIPTGEGQLDNLVSKIDTFISTLNNLKLEEGATNANTALTEMIALIKNAKNTMKSMDTLIQNVDKQELAKDLKVTLADLSTLTNAFSDLSKDFSEESTGYQEIITTLKSLSHTLYELEPVLKQIKRKPNSLIFNSGSNTSIEPKAAQGSDK